MTTSSKTNMNQHNKTQKSREDIIDGVFQAVISDIQKHYKVSDRLYDILSDSLSEHLPKALSQREAEVREETLEEVKQLADNLKVNINSDVDTRTMEYKAYLQRKGHNGALTLLCKTLEQLLKNKN